MKKLFFTSNTNHYHKVNGDKLPNQLDNTNNIVDQLKEMIENYNFILYIAASPDDKEKVDSYSSLIFEGLKMSDIIFNNYLILDNRTYKNAQEYIKKADVIFLSGGNTFIENKFFKKIKLKELLKNYEGVIIGQSAGSINMAEFAYNSPEDGKQSKPIYLEGLGLSNINIEPHFILETDGFDELQIYQRKHLLKESYKRHIYGLTDGSHILETNESVVAYGLIYYIKDGIISQLCNDKESCNINKEI